MSDDNKFVKLNNGLKMPIIGLGTFQFQGDANVLKEAVKTALDSGYRHFDTAYVYQNEQAIGEVINDAMANGKVAREDLFIVTKLPVNGMRPEHVKHFLDLSLKRILLGYVDLYLIHMPIGFQYVSDDDTFPTEDGVAKMDHSTDLVKIWQKMEEMVDLGLAKSIGVSNFSCEQIQRILRNCRIRPVANQIECNAYLQQKKLVDFCQKHDIVITAYGPIGSPALINFMETTQGIKLEVPVLLEDPVIKAISEKYKKTSSQVLLRWLIQRRIVVIPKSVTPNRIKENFDIFNFELGPEDAATIDRLDKNVRMYNLCWLNGMENHPEYKKWIEDQ